MPDRTKAARRRERAQRCKPLLIGPYVFDFGWELGFFNPLARACAKKHTQQVVVVAPETSRYLYEFADKFYPMDVSTEEGENTYLAENKRWTDYPMVTQARKEDWFTLPDNSLVLKEMIEQEIRGHLRDPSEMSTRARAEYYIDSRQWRDLRPPKCKYVADVLLAFCSPKAEEPANFPRSYAHSAANELIDKLRAEGLTIACYGGPSNRRYPNTIDLRGASLETQCSALGAAKIAVGPSSATIHLASLCQTKHVTWCNQTGEPWGSKRDRLTLRNRYKYHYNPFKVTYTYLAPARTSPYRVHKAVMRILNAVDAEKGDTDSK